MEKRYDAQAARSGSVEMVEEYNVRKTVQVLQGFSIAGQKLYGTPYPFCTRGLDRHPLSVMKR